MELGSFPAPKVLFVGTLPPHPGGSAVVSAQILDGLASAGHEVTAVAAMTPEGARTTDRFAADHPRIRVVRFQMPYFETNPFDPVPAEYQGRRRDLIQRIVSGLISENRPDVLVIGREGMASDLAGLGAAFSLPTILAVHGLVVAMVNGTFSPELADPMFEEFAKMDLIVAPARHMAEGLRRREFANVEVILNAVDVTAFRPGPKNPDLLADLAIDPTDVVVVHASNMKPLKRSIDIVHSAVGALREEPRLKYVIVGDGPTRAATEDAARALGIGDHFRFVGWVDRALVADYLRLSDMVIMPSDTEGLALVYLETQACGGVIIASDIPAAREVIADGETGFLFARRNVEDLTGKTLMALRDPELRAAIGRKARRQAVARHSLEKAVKAYAAVIERLARQNRGNRTGPSRGSTPWRCNTPDR